jgi:DNA-binding response OmpR family regulator
MRASNGGRELWRDWESGMSHILVVDDEPQIRAMLCALLEQNGYQVSQAEDGEAAIKLANSTTVDLIILDLLMPGKEGLETLMAFRKEQSPPKIIAVSGGSHSIGVDFLPAALKLGASRTFRKPFHTAELLQAIRELL